MLGHEVATKLPLTQHCQMVLLRGWGPIGLVFHAFHFINKVNALHIYVYSSALIHNHLIASFCRLQRWLKLDAGYQISLGYQGALDCINEALFISLVHVTAVRP
jgi:hypothetical protein